VPAIASTGQPAAAEARAAGLPGFLAKPSTSFALRAMLEDAADWLKTGTARSFLTG
jgi:hypothetical protein